jgi:hypothetical protein
MSDLFKSVISHVTDKNNSGTFSVSDFYMSKRCTIDQPLPVFNVTACTFYTPKRNIGQNKKIIVELSCFEFISAKMYNNINLQVVDGVADRYEDVETEHDWVKYIFHLKSREGYIKIGDTDFFVSWQVNDRNDEVNIRHNYGDVSINFLKGVMSYNSNDTPKMEAINFIEKIRAGMAKAINDHVVSKSSNVDDAYNLMSRQSLEHMKLEILKKQ